MTRPTRLLLAAFLWTGVGVGLGSAGTRWLLLHGGGWRWAAWAGALAAGGAKGFFLLAPRAAANARRIAASDARRPIAETFGGGTWLLVGGMMAAGWTLRHSGLAWSVVGWIYTAVGAALLVGSVAAWSAWARRGGA